MDLMFFSVLLLVTYLFQTATVSMQDSNISTLVVNTSESSCPSYVTFECTVTSTPMGFTFWNGSLFEDCSSANIILVHKMPNIDNIYCKNGSIRGKIINVTGNTSYTSQLNITLNFDIIGRSIECFHDDGTGNNTEMPIESFFVKGSLTIKFDNNYYCSYTSFMSVEIEHAYLRKGSKDLLSFMWNSSIFSNVNGSAIRYNILASNCGSCPSTTNRTTIICSDVPTNGVCAFIAQILVCGYYVGSINHTFPLKTARPDSALLPTLTAGIPLLIAVLILMVGVTVLLWFLYKRYGTSNRFSQSSTAATIHCQTQNSLHEMDTNVYDNRTTVKVFDNKLASGIYGSAANAALKAQYYEDYVPTSGEGKIELESLLAYLRGRVTFQWYKFGAALGVPSSVLENFVKDSEKYSEEKALIKVLEYWLKNHPNQPSWHEVANALRDIIWMS